MSKVAVASRSFSKNPKLREELLARYKNVRFNDQGIQLSGNSLVEFLDGCDKAILGLEVLDESVLSKLSGLKVIGKYGVGLDKLDLKAMDRHGVKLGWTGGTNCRSVAELALMFMIGLLRQLPRANAEVNGGSWKQQSGRDLTGKRVGVIGCGFVGKDVVRLLQPFKCEILSHDLLDFSEFYRNHGVKKSGLDELLSSCDVVSLHIPLDESTRNIISRERLATMKRDAVLINTARGGLIDEEALFVALKESRLGAAGFDVFEIEPPKDRKLLSLSNFMCTPHIGGSAEEAVLAMGRAAIEGLDKFEAATSYSQSGSRA